MPIDFHSLRRNNMSAVVAMRDSIDIAPAYQREGGVWPRSRRALLIDSLINRFDIPKVYLHAVTPYQNADGKLIKYAVIDGRQRLESIWGFFNDEFPLNSDFEFLENSKLGKTARGKTFSQLQEEHHPILDDLLNAQLDMTRVETDDDALIEEMFKRLNESESLKSPEKRNAITSLLRPAVETLVGLDFFKICLQGKNQRLQHHDIATKFLLFAHSKGPVATKKSNLDIFWKEFVENTTENNDEVSRIVKDSTSILESMASVFERNDSLLKRISQLSIYYLVFTFLKENNEAIPSREELLAFEKERESYKNSGVDEDRLDPSTLDLIDYDRLAQSSNDKGSMMSRRDTMINYIRSHRHPQS